ncbi:hypothetical protein C0J29_31940 (plasmid) [Mycobacterium paragordonae]|uniref:AP2 domain-containing protein n=1 Tax=Mycobacterium paragordonae TaxID=1389713 RepID=A0ABQ1CFI4_9MYCO|nr:MULTISPECIES: hypothetical protein [Mycobacterium]AYE99574.1 hypothetical protein C0J29_31940 [Mycobacterium paragordonae]QNI09745.1 hypothetical protein GAN17_25440 [Mycobacterium kubicae]GFG83205.1 hypothetical protein MPRG_64810 [Mycobacterium paragordonae]
MSNVIASAYYKSSTLTNRAGIIIVKERGKYGVGNFQHISGIGERYIIRKRFATEAQARAAANCAWLAEHHNAI